MHLILIALAPVLIILFYVYLRDKYEREPLGLLLTALVAGGIITIPILFCEIGLSNLGVHWWDPSSNVFWTAFVVAALTEELFKYLALYLLIWFNRNFNEKFDGIVYAVFISLGFALVENILYVIQGGVEVGWLRAITAVPAHALFGVVMGYYFGLAKFRPQHKRFFMIRALAAPIILHGIYDFILMSRIPLLLLLFIPYIVYLWISGFRKMRELSDESRFNPEIKP